MQIAKTHALSFLPVPQDQARDRLQSNDVLATTTGQGTQIARQTRTVEDIRQAEQLLNRPRFSNGYGSIAEESRQQRAVAAYQSLQKNDERAYVSEVLGIDVYA